jgi:hypothetical protein
MAQRAPEFVNRFLTPLDALALCLPTNHEVPVELVAGERRAEGAGAMASKDGPSTPFRHREILYGHG